MPLNTDYLTGELDKLTEVEQVIDFCRENDEELVSVSRALNALREHHGLSVSQFLLRCSISKGNDKVSGWFDGTSEPRSRTQYLKIALGLGMNLAETNRFLVRVGEYGCLYPKNISDAAYIHLINTHGKFSEHKALAERMQFELNRCVYDEIADKLPKEFISEYRKLIKQVGEDAISPDSITGIEQQYKKEISREVKRLRIELSKHSDTLTPTETMLDSLCRDEYADMLDYVRHYWRDFVARNYLLLAYIDASVAHSAYCNDDGKLIDTVNKFTFEAVNDDIISESAKMLINTQYSTLKTKGETPSRTVLITLGLLLGETLDSLNNMLDIAGMEPLCAKRGVEAAIRFAMLSSRSGRTVRIADVKDELFTFSKLYESKTLPDLVQMLFSEEEIEEDF